MAEIRRERERDENSLEAGLILLLVSLSHIFGLCHARVVASVLVDLSIAIWARSLDQGELDGALYLAGIVVCGCKALGKHIGKFTT